MPGTLTIVATPIGNLGDITFRAIETLKMVDLVLCEDTRVTKKLLSHFEIGTPTMSYHHHSTEAKMREILGLLQEGKQVALVSDAGTPGISDPGNILINFLVHEDSSIVITSAPGVSAVITALSISGFRTDKFVFLGFPPHKKGRQTFFADLAKNQHTVVFYESNHRIVKCIQELTQVLPLEKEICICRELTKKFETVYRGTVGGLAAMRVTEKGEFVVIIE